MLRMSEFAAFLTLSKLEKITVNTLRGGNTGIKKKRNGPSRSHQGSLPFWKKNGRWCQIWSRSWSGGIPKYCRAPAGICLSVRKRAMNEKTALQRSKSLSSSILQEKKRIMVHYYRLQRLERLRFQCFFVSNRLCFMFFNRELQMLLKSTFQVWTINKSKNKGISYVRFSCISFATCALHKSVRSMNQKKLTEWNGGLQINFSAFPPNVAYQTLIDRYQDNHLLVSHYWNSIYTTPKIQLDSASSHL